ncbi:NAD-dependent succinate-semialdehyde dehydrogenase [Paraburkholderia sp. Ac-20340]|uniref:NAD-dependent succinate-semialdehyde dehydrogenase n=1 Tax=Paraburkholderia sp. Ac-20340 TaxID=2703888 RepID=UPI00197D36AB|nr:NAD-dependent succinate-semialdehyde dehydrogenase [Paraburkholderia sp. Ac-20340]MBN3853487.1 NAD-dependent succinate-semialdehyde dehydrogenase [Paraburkholderia sp. Ac-20340]
MSTSERVACTAPYATLGLLIDGRWQTHAREGEAVFDPATEREIGWLPHADDADISAALAAAQRAFVHWSVTSAYERARVLRRFAERVLETAAAIATGIVRDQGKPFEEALAEVRFAADHIVWHAEECRRIYGREIPSRDVRVQQRVVREPVGVCVAFTPWNFPFSQAVRKVCAALGAGCTLVLKGPEASPSAVVALGRALQEAGLPDGCLNLLWGKPSALSERLIADDIVRKVSFTGSVEVGKQLAALAGRHMKRTTMELGGHAPVLVFADADIDACARALAVQKLRNAGQVCISPTRFYIERPAYERFVGTFTEAMRATRVGAGDEPGVQMGPLCHARRVQAMQDLVDDAIAHGATLATGGSRLRERGYFYAPTVLCGELGATRVMREEPFGPLAAVVPFDSFDGAIDAANALPFGLASYVFTRSAAQAHHAARRLKAGMVSVNHFGLALPETPFGGLHDSGYGSEGGSETFDGYLATRFITQFDPLP